MRMQALLVEAIDAATVAVVDQLSYGTPSTLDGAAEIAMAAVLAAKPHLEALAHGDSNERRG